MGFPKSPSPSLLTPKDLADAIGVSESALRRWIDAAKINVSRTAGGHRRIRIQDAIQFIRQTGSPVVRPELLGLVDLTPIELGNESSGQALFDALQAGDRGIARGVILSAYLQGQSLPQIFDGPFRQAMEHIGQLWQHGPRGIMLEHRATAICIEIVCELKTLIPPLDASAPLAMGGAPPDDPYQLPTMLAAAVIADAGFRDINFGPQTPLHLLAQEAIDRSARFVWISLSVEPAASLITDMANTAELLSDHHIPMLVGGRFAASVGQQAEGIMLLSSMQELSTWLQNDHLATCQH